MKFTPRLTTPSLNNPYYNTPANNGYSRCILGNQLKKCYSKKLNTLPNCVGYSWGRFNEVINENCFKYWFKGNAEDLYLRASSIGLKTGSTPRVGAIICWKLGNPGNSVDGCGHVAIVEQILDKDTIVVSESGWSSDKQFWKATHKRGNGNWILGDDYSWMKRYIFQGFIYNPSIATKDAFGTCPYAEPTKVVKRGSQGSNVKWLQWHMMRLGYAVDVDGSFGPKTETTLKIIQTKYGLVSDGMCGPLTRAMLKKI